MATRQAHRLLQLGILLFLLGLLTGFAMPLFENPRMGLASHLEAILNGIFLIVLGLLWERLRLGRGVLTLAFWLVLYGTFANWLATLLAAVWGAGTMMPMAAGDFKGSDGQELVITILLFSLSFAMIAVSALVLWGLRGPRREFFP
jgi:hydroxylaminobenzene mutase